MNFNWCEEKNKLLKHERGVCFEDVVIAINDDRILDVIDHPNSNQYPLQKIYIVQLNGYVYMVPFITQLDTIFLKTIIPSRKMKKFYVGELDDES